jgi:pyrimidine operon attenuation protein/uracil phosphoribosyltransferase
LKTLPEILPLSARRAILPIKVLYVLTVRSTKKMKVILDSIQIEGILEDLIRTIVSDLDPDQEIATIGIRSRGEILAQRLSAGLSKTLGKEIPCGTLDITLYRDDLNSPQGLTQPEVRTTEIGFNIDDKIIILVDDVLYTGRSARAAMDALIDLGRPRAIKLAVLVVKTGREVPIQADYAGYETDAAHDEVVQVNFTESDGKDQVIIES